MERKVAQQDKNTAEVKRGTTKVNPLLVQFGWNFHFKIRRDHEKNSYERRAYESVDNRSLA